MRTLEQMIEAARPLVADGSRSTKERIRMLWSCAKKCRAPGNAKEVESAFVRLAVEAHLLDTRGYWTGADVRDSVRRHGAEDVRHSITWALRGWNPFERGPLK